jgi:hypothetical protein
MPIGKKYGGRVKGVPNKKTADQKNRAERILQLIDDQYFDKDIKKLTPSQRMILYSGMLEYVAPKLSRSELKGDLKHEVIVRIQRNRS